VRRASTAPGQIFFTRGNAALQQRNAASAVAAGNDVPCCVVRVRALELRRARRGSRFAQLGRAERASLRRSLRCCSASWPARQRLRGVRRTCAWPSGAAAEPSVPISKSINDVLLLALLVLRCCSAAGAVGLLVLPVLLRCDVLVPLCLPAATYRCYRAGRAGACARACSAILQACQRKRGWRCKCWQSGSVR
jgi:hypothetical protein